MGMYLNTNTNTIQILENKYLTPRLILILIINRIRKKQLLISIISHVKPGDH